MATLADSGYPNLANLMRRLRPDGSVETQIANLIAKETPEIDDIPWVEANDGSSHLLTSVTALPSPTWRRYNEGVEATKGDTAQYREGCGMLETFSNVDKALAEQNGNAMAFRQSEDQLKIVSYSEEVARSAFYESSVTNPERVHGLSARYAASSGYTASSYVLPKGTLSGTNCQSIWLISWAPRIIYGIYPKGSNVGLRIRDMGEQLVTETGSKKFVALVTHFKWDLGFAVEDYRYAVRLQWDPDDTTTFPDSGKSMILGMDEMLVTIKKVLPSTRFYMSRTSMKKLKSQLGANNDNSLQYIQSGNQMIPTFQNVKIRVTDTLVGETAIS